jgi:uroporphyrin-III C-methyltransferase/precorrin-2 dehydrogenase/sirohydrochlorin ferrochelatase
MGLKNLPAIAGTLLAHGRSPDTPTAVVQEGTTASQRTVRTTLGAVVEAAQTFRPPAIVVVGEVVGILP